MIRDKRKQMNDKGQEETDESSDKRMQKDVEKPK
jgi:hypothetical protein